MTSRNDPVIKEAQKRQQKESRARSELAGTRGRKEHKGKAAFSNKHTGGKRAR